VIEMLNWAFFPRSAKPPKLALQVVDAFEKALPAITSIKETQSSNLVLSHVAPHLAGIGFSVESGKKQVQKVSVPVLYGNNGQIAKSFDADAHHVAGRFVVEVEAGRGVVNNQFLKDLFQACMMDDVDYLGIAVRNIYESSGRKNPDFKHVVTFFDTLYASDRMRLPLKGILVVGY